MLISVNITFAQTDIEGEVSGIWDTEGSPYRIVGDAVVPENETLEIQPGVTVFWAREGYLYLNGTLIAIGTEEDSVRFISPSRNYCIRNSLAEGGANVVFRHVECEFRNLINGRFVDIDITNSTFQAFDLECYGSLSIHNNDMQFEFPSWESGMSEISGVPDTLVYRDNTMIYSYLVFRGLRDIVLENNDFGFNSSLLLRSCQAIDVTNNLGLGLAIGSASDVQCSNNTLSALFVYIELGASNILLSDNEIRGNCRLGSTRNALVERNDIGGALLIENCHEIVCQNNTVRSHERTSLIDESADIDIFNNTFLNHNINYDPRYTPFRGFESATLRNNIFMSPQPAEYAFESSYQQNSDYNCFFGFDVIFADSSEIAAHDLIADPKMVGGNPYEVDLCFDSPCIDAGDPDFDPDPDGSPADIGAIFFDHDVDHPPAITSQWTNYAGTGRQFSYIAQAVEEDNQFDFSFENLPDWLQPVDQNLDEGWVELAGNMPANHQDFVFEIHVSDEAENEDTLSVFIDCIDATLLSGTLSGTLTSEDSPYAIIDDILVEEGEQLIIGDGVDLVVYPKPACIFEKIAHIDILGSLQVLGLPESKVTFSQFDDGIIDLESFGHNLMINSSDSIIFHFMDLREAYPGYNRTGYLEFVGCKIEQAFVSSRNEHRVQILDSEIKEFSIIADSISFCGNIVKDSYNGFKILEGQYLYMENNQIFDCGHWDFNDDCLNDISIYCADVVFLHNLFYNNICGVIFYDAVNVIFNSNTVANLTDYGVVAFSYVSEELTVSNNIFSNTLSGIVLPQNGADITVCNNLVDVRGTGIFNPVNNMGVVDRVNQNGDSTDAFGNMFLPAELIDFGPRPFAPLESSPAVDAGSDDLEDDPDWTPPDIGYWSFDHENHAPRIYQVWPLEFGADFHDTIMVQIEPNLRQDFHVGVEEYTDIPQGRWILNNAVISNKPCIYGNYGFYECRDTIQFMDDGINIVKFQVTDGNNIAEVIWQVAVGNVGVDMEIVPPQEFTVLPAFPNPFNSTTTIGYSLPAAGNVSLMVYDLSGREVARLAEGVKPVGTHSVSFNGDGLASGVYVVKLDAGGEIFREKVVLVK